MKRGDWALLALYYAEQPLYPVHMQKILFLLSRAGADAVGDDFYDFQPWDYGPFSSQVYWDLEKAAEEGLVVIDASGRVRHYSLSPAGEAHAQELAKHLDPKMAEYLKRVTEWAKGLSFSDLVRAIYQRFPEYKTRSVFAD
ncbi:MAG: hypothetical protein AKCLJLPJ_02209 [Fimbriimonadales bacterium]|nr:hypothetical protein [Fimbriimonadales bacterium]